MFSFLLLRKRENPESIIKSETPRSPRWRYCEKKKSLYFSLKCTPTWNTMTQSRAAVLIISRAIILSECLTETSFMVFSWMSGVFMEDIWLQPAEEVRRSVYGRTTVWFLCRPSSWYDGFCSMGRNRGCLWSVAVTCVAKNKAVEGENEGQREKKILRIFERQRRQKKRCLPTARRFVLPVFPGGTQILCLDKNTCIKKSLDKESRLMHFLWCPRRESNTRPTA